MKKTLSIWRGARLCALGCVLLLALATAAYASSFSGTKPRFDESRLGRYVLFPGIGEPVRVAPLEGVAGMYSGYPEMKLPDEVVDKLIRARDRNALWLLCEARRDYLAAVRGAARLFVHRLHLCLRQQRRAGHTHPSG